MRRDANCFVCKIAAGEIPASKVHEDEHCLAFNDLNPQAPTHILIIPREHIARVDEAVDTDARLLGHLLLTAGRIADKAGLKEGGFRLAINSGAGAGQSVFHIHIHLLGGRPFNWPPG